MNKRILVVDDEKLIVKGIRYSLEQDGMQVDCAYDGEEAVQLASSNHYDMILLDLMLPKLSGYEVCERIREFSNTPIIMLTAKGDDIDKIMGLDAGADDYVTKPFNILEVKARMKAIMRRSSNGDGREEQLLMIRNMKLDGKNRRVYIDHKEVKLTSKEFDVLWLLATNPNKVYSREQLMSIIWGFDFPGDLRTVDVHVRRLREKIEVKPREPEFVQTKWGSGYYFNEDE